MSEPRRKLDDLYVDLAMEEPLLLEDFLKRVARGEWGAYTPDEIAAYLDKAEQDTIENIDLLIQANPGLAAWREQKIEETAEEFARLRRLYAGR